MTYARCRRRTRSYHVPFPALGWVEKTAEDYRLVPLNFQLML